MPRGALFKNKMKLGYLIILFFVFSSLPVLAYNQTGTYDKDFLIDGIGFFNDEITSDSTSTRTLSIPRQSPLIADLDYDGTDEIIVLDDSTFRLYHGSSLDIVDAYALPSGDRFSNTIIFDIDGDSLPEIIISMPERNEIHIVEYNGTSFYEEYLIDMDGNTNHATGSTGGDVMIQCRGVNDCFSSYVDEQDTGFTPGFTKTRRIYGAFFNSTNISSEKELDNTGAGFQTYCMPSLGGISVIDYNNDGDKEYIFSAMQSGGSSDEEIEIFWINVQTNGSVSKDHQASVTAPDDIVAALNSDTPVYCDNSNGNIDDGSGQAGEKPAVLFTSPLVFDIDGSSSNGKEAVIGFMIDQDSYKMNSYDSSGSFLDDYPEILTSDGVIVSNVVRANTFTDTGAVDFCVMGFRQSDNFLVFTCASEQTGQLTETDQFDFDFSSLYNISSDPNLYTNMIHAVDMSRDTTDGNNLNEILSSYGIFELDFSGLNELFLIYESPIEDLSVIASDPEKVGQLDLIGVSDTNIWYIDDGFSNSPATITDYYISPCIDSVWQLNTSVEVRITASDVNGDQVSARSVLYQGTTNEQDSGYSGNYTSGTTFTFEQIANKTGTNQELGLYAIDTINGIADEIDIAYSVGTSGVVNGECSTEVTINATGAEADSAGNESLTPQETNPVKNSLIEINSFLKIGLTAIWLLIIIIVDIVLISGTREYFKGWESRYIFAILALIDVSLVILGAILLVVPVWLIILLIILGIAISVIWVVSKFDASGA